MSWTIATIPAEVSISKRMADVLFLLSIVKQLAYL